MRLLLLILIVPMLHGCVSRGTSLGHGYRIVHRTVDMRGVERAFEATAHYSDLYYFRQRLGEVGTYSISPSGRFALFEDTGRLMLFNRQARQTRVVTDGTFAVPREFAWDESGGIVNVTYYDKHTPSRIKLE